MYPSRAAMLEMIQMPGYAKISVHRTAGLAGQMNIETVTSHANFILANVGDGAGTFKKLQECGVITRPMAGYQLPEWIRISIGTPTENEHCLNALRKLR